MRVIQYIEQKIYKNMLLPTAGDNKRTAVASRSLKLFKRRIDFETKFDYGCYSRDVTLFEQCTEQAITRSVAIYTCKL